MPSAASVTVPISSLTAAAGLYEATCFANASRIASGLIAASAIFSSSLFSFVVN
jgi:hypothetical protein